MEVLVKYRERDAADNKIITESHILVRRITNMERDSEYLWLNNGYLSMTSFDSEIDARKWIFNLFNEKELIFISFKKTN